MKPLFDKTTTAIFYNQHPNPIQRMLDFDYVCGRKTPSVSAIVNPNQAGQHKVFFGTKEILIPVYKTLNEACEKHSESDVLVNFASARSAFDVSKEAIQKCLSIRTIHIMAEGMTENQTRELIRLAKEGKKFLIGPSTVGAIIPGAFRTGEAAGSMQNIIDSRLYRQGSVGVVTVSGGISNEVYNIVSQNADGTAEGIAIGGDKFPGSTLLENLLRIQENPQVKMLVCLGEIGGEAEYEVVEALKQKKIDKPLVIWVTGTIASQFKTEVQFGHAGARSGNERVSAQAKNKALAEAGAFVPKSFDEFGDKIKEIFDTKVKNQSSYTPPDDQKFSTPPMDFKEAVKQGIVRKATNITSSISDERGEEPTYNGKPISDYADKSIGHLINALWFKNQLPEVAEEFIELCIKLAADHGPAVSTAHNAIVTSRAGNSVIMSLIAGLTTIGPRHGGAIDGAAEWLLDAVTRNIDGKTVVAEHKAKGQLIMGIGHRIKTAQNPDKRVEILKNFANKNLKSHSYLSKALEVENETLKKKNTLILNLDGAIGAVFLDILVESNMNFDEIKKIVNIGALNALFALARSIGMIGHALDQKRMDEPMYRHDTDDILYC